jgi:hypothetical protein
MLPTLTLWHPSWLDRSSYYTHLSPLTLMSYITLNNKLKSSLLTKRYRLSLSVIRAHDPCLQSSHLSTQNTEKVMSFKGIRIGDMVY